MEHDQVDQPESLGDHQEVQCDDWKKDIGQHARII